MFKKNPNRPPMVVSIKRTQGGYKIVPNEGHTLFQVKRIIRTMYRPDLVPQGSTLGLQQNGMSIPSTIIQPPSHFTFPAFAAWFSLEEIHQIEKEAFPQFFESAKQEIPFSFGVRNSKLYKYYRNTMIGMWLENVKKHLSAAHCRRTLVGDVSLIVRIHGFLENWGLINFPSREHNKGVQLKAPERLTCYVCQEAEGQKYYVAPVEDVIFQLCQNCFQQGLYPSELGADQFVQVLHKNYTQNKHRLMTNSQLVRLLDILVANGGAREREKDIWAAAQKQFSQFSREQLVYNFLRVPTLTEMNGNIFENNEDVVEESQPSEEPTIFQDYQNPLQAAIAVAYYRFKKFGDQSGKLQKIFKASEQHSQFLARMQQQKIEQLTKMLVDVSFSKLQLKSIFIQEYQKLVEKCLLNQQSVVSNTLAECLKQNLRFVESCSEPEQLEGHVNGEGEAHHI